LLAAKVLCKFNAQTMQLYFKESGQGEPVILLHGLFGSSDNWYYIAQKLAVKFRVIAVDQRNQGQSPHSMEMDYPSMAGDVAELMTAQRIPSAAVVGHSMGGKTAMQFALQFPDLVEKLVVADMAPRGYEMVHDKIFAALLALDLSAFAGRAQMEEVLAPAIPRLTLRRFLLKNLGRDALGNFFWKINLRGLADNYARLREPLSSAVPFTKPALFVRGGKSDFITAADETRIRELFPAAQIETMSEAGHWLHADQPEEFGRLLLNFL
jgi:pimeloyl-ACP methyl ester carboxylesterase